MRWILAGKFLVLAAVACLQALIVFTVGGLVYDIDLLLSLPAALATAVAISFVWTSLSLALVSVSNSLGKVNALTQLGLLVLGGLGGGLAPTETMPQIIQWLAPLTPTYWAIEAMTQSTSNDGNFIGVFVALLALLAFSVPLLIVVVRRASLDQRRTT